VADNVDIEVGIRSELKGCQKSDVRIFNERPYVFRFCATKNLNSKKPWKKGKIIVFSFGKELLLMATQKSSGK